MKSKKAVNNRVWWLNFLKIQDFKKIFKLVLPIFIQTLILNIITLATAIATTYFNRVYHIDGSYNGAYFYLFSKIVTIYKIMTFLPIMFQLGVLVVVSNLYGQQRYNEIKSVISSASIISLIINICCYLLMFFLAPMLLNLAGAKDEILLGWKNKDDYQIYLNNLELIKQHPINIDFKNTLLINGGEYVLPNQNVITFNNTNAIVIQINELNFAIKFFRITTVDLFIFSIAQILIASLQGMKKNIDSMIAVVTGLIVRLIWTYVWLYAVHNNNFVIWVSLETIVGATTQLIVAYIMLVIIVNKKEKDKFNNKIKIWNNKFIKRVLYIGFPIALEHGIWFVAQYFVANSIPFAKLNEEYIGLFRAMNGVFDIFTTFVLSLSVVVNVLVSIEIGQKNYTQAYHTSNQCFKLGTYAQIIFSILGFALTHPLLMLFGINTQTISKIGYIIMFIAFAKAVFDVGNLTTLRALWSANDVWMPILVAIICMLGIQLTTIYLIVYFKNNLTQSTIFILIILASTLDPLLRSILFELRWKSFKWIKWSQRIAV
ncbi:MATE efflux family protein [Metamycoplasma cloacale]|uniref:Probable multidrug resistance protein NorM n=1 Tax=Metamycoplasma cloacale TaxID=92401 RepID=A0A2Z4LLB3_9BACT|nr:MATE family efflux transporter [Metamycoplasma cloacale]AWX42539.1 hypothetical protein DK849_00345 [Metamycoplasma cloacale]VEU79115.1 MATE efflux family protein [Metamycoplasma cloacale]VEU79794.1 MATE efflux family protein [Metamycoplasma cloacale]